MARLIKFIDTYSGNWFFEMFIVLIETLIAFLIVYIPFYYMFGWVEGLLYTYVLLIVVIFFTILFYGIRYENQKKKESQNVPNVDIVTEELSEEKQQEFEKLLEVYSLNRQSINLFVQENHLDEDKVWKKANERFENKKTQGEGNEYEKVD